jgi:hypothetical protein
VGNPSDIPTMREKFAQAKAYLEGRASYFDRDWFEKLNLLEGTDTQVRIEAALHDWVQSPEKDETVFIPSGDKLRPDSEQVVSDALLMGVYLLLRGVPRAQIMLEEKAADTSDNARFIIVHMDKAMAREKLMGAIATVYSEKNHLHRFWYAFLAIRFWRWVLLRPEIIFRYRETGPKLNLFGLIREQIFLVILMPLGKFNPIGAALRAWRRSNGRK